jgi:hypothetical protein
MIRLICRASYNDNDRGGSVGPTAHPSRALPLAEMDLPGGGARAKKKQKCKLELSREMLPS